jgi:hypothetical protein
MTFLVEEEQENNQRKHRKKKKSNDDYTGHDGVNSTVMIPIRTRNEKVVNNVKRRFFH